MSSEMPLTVPAKVQMKWHVSVT